MRRSTMVLVLLLVSASVEAQSEFRPGVKVRIQAPGVVAGEVVGTLLSKTADSIVIGSDELAPLAIPTASVTSIEIGHGSSRGDGALRGLAWGTGIGAVIGVMSVSSLTTCRTENGVRNCSASANSTERNAYVGAVSFAGAFYGVLIGALFPVEKWDRLDIAPHTAIALRGGKPTISWSATF